jgi:plastocyanin
MHRGWLALAAVLLTAGCGGDAPPGSPGDGSSTAARPGTATVVEVRLTCDTGNPDAPCAFFPAQVSIRVGGTVRWVNDDATYHTVTSSDRSDLRVPDGRFDAVLDAAGETFSYTFDSAGTYPYYCQPHAEFMAGTVRVGRRVA